MTTQEFVKKEAKKEADFRFGLLLDADKNKLAVKEYENGNILGLTKGLEIANEFAEWQSSEGLFQKGERWFDYKGDLKAGDTSELLTIFLTEK